MLPIINIYAQSNKQIRVGGFEFNMIFVEGETDIIEDSNIKNNRQKKNTKIDSFMIGETEVTQALWAAVMPEEYKDYCIKAISYNLSIEGNITGRFYHILAPNYPMYDCTQNTFDVFISKLNQLTGLHFRKPTEAEWKFAAKGGNKSKGYIYSGSNNIDEVGWYLGNSDCRIHEVSAKKPNELGIYDMSGNVDEICSDGHDYYESDSSNIHHEPNNAKSIPICGGSFYNSAVMQEINQTLWRYKDPAMITFGTGLRLALDVEQ